MLLIVMSNVMSNKCGQRLCDSGFSARNLYPLLFEQQSIHASLTDEQIIEGVVLLLHLLPEEHREAEHVADEAEDAYGHVAVTAKKDLVLSNESLAFVTITIPGWSMWFRDRICWHLNVSSRRVHSTG